MTFIKYVSTLLIALSIFSSTVLSMQNDIDEETPILRTPAKKKECCSHWGLSHWCSGIGEYIERFCWDWSDRKDGRYVLQSASSNEIEETTDCYFFSTSNEKLPKNRNICDCLCMSCVGTLCCPVIAIFHLCCLPCSCCECSEQSPSVYKRRRPYVAPAPIQLPSSVIIEREEKARKAREDSIARHGKHVNCTSGVCHPGPPHECTKR